MYVRNDWGYLMYNPDLKFTKQFIEYIKDNTNKHIQQVDLKANIVYGRVTTDYIEDREDWWKLAEVLHRVYFKQYNYIQEINLCKFDDVYQLEFAMKNTDKEWKQ